MEVGEEGRGEGGNLGVEVVDVGCWCGGGGCGDCGGCGGNGCGGGGGGGVVEEEDVVVLELPVVSGGGTGRSMGR